MAIKLDKNLESGVMANYWRIMSVRFDRDSASWICNVLLGLFVSEEAAKLGRMPISIEGRVIDMPRDINSTDIVGAAYDSLKLTEEFCLAEDC